MKIRDLLVIAFTAVVALLLFLRSARADVPSIEDGVGGGRDIDGKGGHEGASSAAHTAASGAAPEASLGCSASPGAATTTLLNSLAAFLAVGLVARRRRR